MFCSSIDDQTRQELANKEVCWVYILASMHKKLNGLVVFVQILYKSNKNALVVFGLGELDEKESGFI